MSFDRLKLALAGRYGIEKEIGAGGMATVYLAQDLKHDRKVALKVMRPELSAVLGPDRFLREIRFVAKLNHPHVLALYDSGQVDTFLYYVMPMVTGESLRARLNREGTVKFDDVVAISKEVADALSYAHRQGVVHRDIKPENILLSEGHAIVADFGIAKALTNATDEPLTRTGFPLGTPGYMSPEQAAAGSDIDERTDVYSLACVTYEMLVGSPPSRWITEAELRDGKFLKAPPQQRAHLANLPNTVERALVRALAIDADERFDTPEEFARALVGSTETSRRYAESEAKDILRRAAAMDATESTPASDFSLDTVREIAAEVDIPTRHVMAAAKEVAQPAREPELASKLRPTRVLGIPAGETYSEFVDGEVPPSEHALFLEMIEETFGGHGQVEHSVGESLVWSAATRDLLVSRVQILPRAGRTKITVMEDRSGVLGVGIGLGSVIMGAIALPIVDSGANYLLPLMGVVAGGGIFWVKTFWKKRREKLAGLMHSLTRHAEYSIARLSKGGNRG